MIINEAHHAPRHRAFTHQLMAALRNEGFSHFAAETFCSTCPVLLANGVSTAADGPYILDPVFADLARQAVSAGYAVDALGGNLVYPVGAPRWRAAAAAPFHHRRSGAGNGNAAAGSGTVRGTDGAGHDNRRMSKRRLPARRRRISPGPWRLGACRWLTIPK